MEVLRSRSALPRVGPADLALTIGNFDGFHLGHAAVVAELAASSARHGAFALLVTFEPHPISLLGRMERPFVLSPTAEKAAAMEGAGLGALLVLDFTRALASEPARTFLAGLGVGRGSRLVLGYDFRMGPNRETDLRALSVLGTEEGFGLEIIPPVMHGGAPISSSRIREALWGGDAGSAAAMLGRPYRLAGRVVRGSGAAARLGFPTANIELPPEKLLPADGVYLAAVGAEPPRPGLLYIGTRPTLERGERRAEVHVIDGPGPAYGDAIDVDVVRCLRGERVFPSASELALQMRRDVEHARRLVRAGT